MSSRLSARFTRLCLATVFIVILTCIFSSGASRSQTRLLKTIYGTPRAEVSLIAPPALALNRTLGFSEVFLVNLDERTDRKDAMLLLSQMTGFRFRRMPGVKGEDIIEQARPANIPSSVTTQALGCWRAHANVWDKMLEEDLETAIIFEDDADWDLDLKNQLRLAAEAIQLHTSSSKEDAPYGLDWDVIYFGHCGNRPTSSKLVGFSYEDPTTPDLEHTSSMHIPELIEFNLTEPDRRVISVGNHPLCLQSYAITRRGAERLLYYVGYTGLDGQVDLAMAKHIEVGNLKALVVSPPLVAQFKTGSNRDSNIEVERMAKGGKFYGGSFGGTFVAFRKSARKALKAYMEAP